MQVNRQELIRLRRSVPLTQRELGELAEVGESTLQYIELGLTRMPRPSTMRAIAKALGVSVADLTCEDDDDAEQAS